MKNNKIYDKFIKIAKIVHPYNKGIRLKRTNVARNVSAKAWEKAEHLYVHNYNNKDINWKNAQILYTNRYIDIATKILRDKNFSQEEIEGYFDEDN